MSISTSGPGPGDKKSADASSAGSDKAGASKSGAPKAGATKAGATKPGGLRTGSSTRSEPSRPGAGKGAAARSGAQRGRGRKAPPVAVKKSKPWGLIAGAIAVVLFAGAAIGYAVYQVNSKAKLSDPASIQGLVTRSFPGGQHTTGPVPYDASPPFGGMHDPTWADCTGTVYPLPIRNENAVHSLEHGAVWITYNPQIPNDQLKTLFNLVDGVPYMMMSPYPNLDPPISLQAWGNQLFVKSATDPRVAQFVRALKQNPKTTPELGASCDNPTFKANPKRQEPTSPINPSGVPSGAPGGASTAP